MSEAAAIMGREGARSLGAQFAAAREKRGLSLEKASSETRIRVQRLREIERDDFSHFSHPSYARMFAIDYAKYLGIPISRVRRLLPDAGECGAEGYQYLRETACDYMRTDIARSAGAGVYCPSSSRLRSSSCSALADSSSGLQFATLSGWASIAWLTKTKRNLLSRKIVLPRNL